MFNQTIFKINQRHTNSYLFLRPYLIRIITLFCLLSILISLFPPQRALAQDQSRFVVELSRFRVVNKHEDSGDDPYFAVIGFRSRYRTPGSTQTSWSEALFEIGTDMEPGEERFINERPEMGRMSFSGVELFTFDDLTYGKFPEVLGALVLALDSNACSWDTMRAGLKKAKEVLHQKLVELIEQGQLNPANLNESALTGIRDEIESKAVAAATAEAKSNFDIFCGIDKDEIIDYHLFLYTPVEPGIGNHIPRSTNPKISWGAVDNQANQIHEFEINAGEGIVFEGAGAKWETTVIVSSHPTAPPAQPACPKSIQTISRSFLPLVQQNPSQVQGTLLYTQTQIQALQYNVQFLTPWNESALPGHWPNTDDRATAVGKALACYDIVALNETVNDDRRQKIFQTMNQYAPSCGKPNLLPGAEQFAMVDGPDVPELDTHSLPALLDSIASIRNKPAREQGQPMIGDEVAIVSRFPIIATDSHIYSASTGVDSLAGKGVVHARLRQSAASTDYLDVFATHLQAGDAETGLCQIAELADFMAAHTEPGVPVLLLGDFNLNGSLNKQQGDEYRYLMNTLGLLSSGQTLEDLGRFLGGTNQDNDPAKHRTERIDYIFASPTGLMLNNADVKVNEFDGNGWGTLSDHAGVEAMLNWQTATFVPALNRPDLVVERVEITASGVQVTIKNIGTAPVLPGDNFWVDVYLAPHTSPTSVNQIWQDMGEYGLTWAVLSSAFPLPSGAQIVLDLHDPYYVPGKSSFPAELAAGSQVFAQVDSAEKDSGFGGVLESHEELNLPYNNIYSFTLTNAVTTTAWITGETNSASAASMEAEVQRTTPRQ